eukprot:483716_1
MMSVGLLLSLIHVQITNGLSEYRLPTTIKPINYDLELQFHFNQTTDSSFMSGMSHILLNITNPQPIYIQDTQSYIFQVKLNMGSNINIIDSSLHFHALNTTLDFVDFIHNKNTQIATFNYDADIIQQDIIDLQSDTISAEIYVLFKTKLINDYNAGMYITSYEYNETIIQNAVSSFGLTDARLAFPCFDEPTFKATFDFTVIAPLNTTVISNAAILGEQSLKNEICNYQYSWGQSTKCKTVIFETTPIIAPYVLTIFVGEYKSVSDVDENNIMQTVWAPINEYEYGKFALDAGLKVLPYFQDLFIFNYGLNKMDNIAVSSFPWGAMESYGAVVYNKNYILSEHSADKSYIAQLVAHEYAHMWFGDIVTCKWWDDTWLNEGFAQFYGYDTAHIFYPELHILTDWINEKKDMMLKDISMYTESIVGENIESVSQIFDMFGDYQYTKAGAVLEMMKYVMGNETFNQSIVEYIHTYKHINAESKDLINIFNSYYEHSGDMLHSYIMQPGVPIVYVDAGVEADTMIWTIRQERFIKQGSQFYSQPYFDPDNVNEQFD